MNLPQTLDTISTSEKLKPGDYKRIITEDGREEYYNFLGKISPEELVRLESFEVPEPTAGDNGGDDIDCCFVNSTTDQIQDCDFPFHVKYQERGLQWTNLMIYQFVKFEIIKKFDNSIVFTDQVNSVYQFFEVPCVSNNTWNTDYTIPMGSLPCDVYKIVFEKGYVDLNNIRIVCGTDIEETVVYTP